jgi:hypothetical protein
MYNQSLSPLNFFNLYFFLCFSPLHLQVYNFYMALSFSNAIHVFNRKVMSFKFIYNVCEFVCFKVAQILLKYFVDFSFWYHKIKVSVFFIFTLKKKCTNLVTLLSCKQSTVKLVLATLYIWNRQIFELNCLHDHIFSFKYQLNTYPAPFQ